jgi:hypothetical protein
VDLLLIFLNFQNIKSKVFWIKSMQAFLVDIIEQKQSGVSSLVSKIFSAKKKCLFSEEGVRDLLAQQGIQVNQVSFMNVFQAISGQKKISDDLNSGPEEFKMALVKIPVEVSLGNSQETGLIVVGDNGNAVFISNRATPKPA